MLTVIIPSKNEKYLDKTILDVLVKAKGDVEVIVTLDGVDVERLKDPRISYILLKPSKANQKRHGINKAVKQSIYPHIMVLDAHCLMSLGYDEGLIKHCPDNAVMIPRRMRLDPDKWETIQDERLPVDYEYPMLQDLKKGRLHSYKWNQRTEDRWAIPIDDTMGFQGSCYFMHKDYFNHLGLMQTEGYGGFAQESEQITCEVLKDGGRILTNKVVQYSHLHKGKQYGRMYDLNWDEVKISIDYSFNEFVNNNRELFIKHIERFMPLPNYPSDWQKYLPWIDSNT